MKVLMINSVCGIRSTGRICTDIAMILESQGHEVKIAYGREMVPEQFQKYAVHIGTETDVKIHAVKARLFDAAGLGSKSGTKKFIKWVKLFNPDVIHLHNLHGYYLNIEILFQYLKECKKRIIWTLHDCWALTGHCSYFTAAKCEQWKTHCSYCCQLKDYPKCILKGNVYKNFDLKKKLFTNIKNLTIVTPSKWLADRVRESFLCEYDIISIPNGIDLEKFKPTESTFRKDYGIEQKKIVLGVATAWGDRKGIIEFQKLANMLDDKYKVVMVGVTRKQANALPESIIKIERTNSIQELAAIYTAADVFLNLGKEETMGLTTVEAMACGTPVLVSNLTAVPEVVNSQSGIVLENMRIETIIEGIDNILNKEYKYTRDNAVMYEKKHQYKNYLKEYVS